MLGRLLNRGPVRGGRHRDVQGSAARAGVLGAGDGLITNISLILGVAGASTMHRSTGGGNRGSACRGV